MEAIPYEIVNDDTEKYRESTYRSRAIVRRGSALQWVLSLRPENKPVHLTREWRRAIFQRNIMSPPLMQVIPSACESCEENKYEVSNVCKRMPCTSLSGGLSERCHLDGERTVVYRSGQMYQMRQV